MKLYVVSRLGNGLNTGEDLYYLLTEQGELIDSWFSSSKWWAMNDLFSQNKKNKELIKEKFGHDIQVLYLGDDDMTDTKLKELNKKFYNS